MCFWIVGLKPRELFYVIKYELLTLTTVGIHMLKRFRKIYYKK